MLIENHPKMINMWAKRIREVNGKYGTGVATRWAKGMFSEFQMQLINEELAKKKDVE